MSLLIKFAGFISLVSIAISIYGIVSDGFKLSQNNFTTVVLGIAVLFYIRFYYGSEDSNNKGEIDYAKRFKNEKEDFFPNDNELKQLSKYKHTLDFKFTDEQKKFLDDNGYLVIKGVITPEDADEMVEQMFERANKLFGLDKNDEETWKVLGSLGFLDIWHVPKQYEIRQNPKLYSIFAQLLRRHDLTVSLDRVSMKPPRFIERNGEKIPVLEVLHGNFPVHTDMNLWDLEETKYQGSFCLSDCPKGAGGFQAVPGFHKLDRIRKYRDDYIKGRITKGKNPTPPQDESFFNVFLDNKIVENEVIEIPMQKGDFLIWNNRLPHSNTKNTTKNWRTQCFVRMIPTT